MSRQREKAAEDGAIDTDRLKGRVRVGKNVRQRER